jgi:hypothetical protein
MQSNEAVEGQVSFDPAGSRDWWVPQALRSYDIRDLFQVGVLVIIRVSVAGFRTESYPGGPFTGTPKFFRRVGLPSCG